MTPAFEMVATVTRPVDAIEDAYLSLDRVRAVLDGNNTDLIDEIAQCAGIPDAIADRAMQMWMINVVVSEKLDEIGKVLTHASGRLRFAASQGEAA